MYAYQGILILVEQTGFAADRLTGYLVIIFHGINIALSPYIISTGGYESGLPVSQIAPVNWGVVETG
jgi:hypothetical protein